MKTFLYLVALLLLLCLRLGAQTITNLPFVWEPGISQPPASANGWKFYERFGASRVLLAGITGESNRLFIVTNFVLGSSRVFVVTATNLAGEGPECVPYVSPVAPAQATNLHPVTSSLETAVPGVIEISQDLNNWVQRIRLAPAQNSKILVSWVAYPTEPLLFMRSKSPPAITTPPLPRSSIR